MEEKDNDSFPTMLQKDLETIKVVIPKVVCRKPVSVLHLFIALQSAYEVNTLHFDNLLIEECLHPLRIQITAWACVPC